MWTKQETLRLRELQTGFNTVDEIAADLNKSQLDVTNKLMSMGYKPIQKKSEPEQTSFPLSKAVEIPQTKSRNTADKKRKKRTQVTPEIEKRVCELREQRFKFSEIEEMTGIDQTTASRIVQRNGMPREKRYVETKKEPAHVAVETSSDIKTQDNTTPNVAVCKELIIQARDNLQNIEDISCAICADAHRIGHALGLIEAALNIMEV